MTFKLTGTARTIMWIGVVLLAVSALLIVFMPLVLGWPGNGNTGPGQTIGTTLDLIVRLVREIGAPLGAAFVGAALVIGARNDDAG